MSIDKDTKNVKGIKNVKDIENIKGIKNADANACYSFEDGCCGLCNRDVDPELTIICNDYEKCGNMYHTYCANLPGVPTGDWYCPKCSFDKTKFGELSSCCTSSPEIQKKLLSSKKSYKLYPGDQVVAYIRVSSMGQDKPEFGRVGLLTQNNTILKIVLESGTILNQTFKDVGTGLKVHKLVGMQKLIDSLENNICIIVYSISRLGRNYQQVLNIIDQIHAKNCWIYSVTNNINSHDPTFLDYVRQADQQSKDLSRVMKESVNRRRDQKSYIGPAPFGYIVCKDDYGRRILAPNAEEQSIIQTIKSKYNSKINAKDIASYLNNKQILKRSKKWNRLTVLAVLKSSIKH